MSQPIKIKIAPKERALDIAKEWGLDVAPAVKTKRTRAKPKTAFNEKRHVQYYYTARYTTDVFHEPGSDPTRCFDDREGDRVKICLVEPISETFSRITYTYSDHDWGHTDLTVEAFKQRLTEHFKDALVDLVVTSLPTHGYDRWNWNC